MRYNLHLKLTDGKVPAGVFAQVSLSADEHHLMCQHLVASPIFLVPVDDKPVKKVSAKKTKKADD